MNNTTQITIAIGRKTYQENQVAIDAALASLNSESNLYQFVLSFRDNYFYPRTQTSYPIFRRAFERAWMCAEAA